MRKYLSIAIILMIYNCTSSKLEYPETTKLNVVDTFYSIPVQDPYRWLEDENSEETKQWINAQNKTTFDYLNQLPHREEIKTRLTELWNYSKMYTPFSLADKWFVFKNNGLQNQDLLYMLDNFEDEGRVILDPNGFSDDGTIALAGLDVSSDGKYLVYIIAKSGSDWNEIFVKNLETGELLSDHIQWVKFSGISCYKNGFFYSAYDKPTQGAELSASNTGQKVFYHTIGESQDRDVLIYQNSDVKERMYTASLDFDKEYLFMIETESTSGNALHVKSLKKHNSTFIQLAEGFDSDFMPIEVVDDTVFVLTNYKAPKYRLVKIDINQPAITNWVDCIPESENTLLSASFCGSKIFAEYMVDAKSRLEVYAVNGKFEAVVHLPEICKLGSFKGTKYGDIAFYSYSSFKQPGTVVKYNIQSGVATNYFSPELKVDPDQIEMKQVFYSSKDGTQIPMFIVHKKGIELDGNNSALLYGYGGFNISLDPEYSTSILYYVEQGGVYAQPSLRGGGEYGEDWHKAGVLTKKQNVFDDFIAAAEFLIDAGYTNNKQLAIKGASNGGLLIGAVTNQRPDLFKVSLPGVGVMDMLRYHKFTIGYAWATDYGTVSDSETMFKYLLGYSPIHNVVQQEYPAILVTTADHDDRVVPAHSYKYISRIQELNTGSLPTLIRIDVDAGHGAGKPTSKVIEELTDVYAFVFYHTFH